MKKIVVIGDIHGRDIWKRIFEKEDVYNNTDTAVVFLGDYFDSYDIPSGTQRQNMEEIVTAKNVLGDRMFMLIGNHDYHYLIDGPRYSGYQPVMKHDFKEILKKLYDENKLLACCIDPTRKYLFSHAGISKTWCNDVGITEEQQLEPELHVNMLFKTTIGLFNFSDSGHNMYGDDVCQGPLWIRPFSLMKDCIEPWVHVVGHTAQESGIEVDEDCIFTDSFNDTDEYLTLVGPTFEPRIENAN